MGKYSDNAKSACSKYDDAIVKISNLKNTYNECLGLLSKISGVDEVDKLNSSLNSKIDELNNVISKINSIKSNIKSRARHLDEEEIRKAVEAQKQADARRQALREIKADRL